MSTSLDSSCGLWFLSVMNEPGPQELEYAARLARIEQALAGTIPEQIHPGWTAETAGEELPVAPELFDRINAPARELLLRGGKRWRPLVMLLSCELAGGTDEALPLTPLVELPHNGSLIIDDIEDGAVERRGAKAVHLLYGTDLAINAGNLLYFLPSSLIERSEFSPERKLLLYRVYLRYMRRLHLGQGLDILWHRNHDEIPEPAEYFTMCRMKTGCLAAMGAELGALCAGADETFSSALGRLLEDLGTAFQVSDDVKNLTTGNPGKHRGDDIVEGKKSLPVILHLGRSPADKALFAGTFRKAAEQGIDRSEAEIERLIGLMEASGALTDARETALKLAAEVKTRLLESYPDSQARALLAGLIEMLL
jgi:geranylgeranyl pyrophosphate synthase